MVEIKTLREYLNMPPDMNDDIASLCLNAAKSKARAAGIPEFQNNAQYDLFLCALSGLWYDNRNMCFVGTGGNTSVEKAARDMINSFVLELRYAEDDQTEEQMNG